MPPPPLPKQVYEGEDLQWPECILDHKLSKNKTMYLVQWQNGSEDDATWEFERDLNTSLLDAYWSRHIGFEAEQLQDPLPDSLEEA